MTRGALRTAGLVLLGLGVAAIGATLWELAGSEDEGLVFRSVAMPPSPGKRLIQVAFGEAVNQAIDYPASLAAEFQALIQCSGTLVGPDTILTAEHCLRRAAEHRLPITVHIRENAVRATCSAWQSIDIALCKLETPVSGIAFDVIAADPDLTAEGTAVLLTGWTNASPPILTWILLRMKHVLGFPGTFKVGRARIVEGGAELRIEGDRSAGGAVALEGGDSGGAAYVGDVKRRFIVGVNKCGGPGCAEGGGAGTSTVASVVFPAHARIVRDWAKENGAQVCGVTPAVGCRTQQESGGRR